MGEIKTVEVKERTTRMGTRIVALALAALTVVGMTYGTLVTLSNMSKVPSKILVDGMETKVDINLDSGNINGVPEYINICGRTGTSINLKFPSLNDKVLISFDNAFFNNYIVMMDMDGKTQYEVYMGKDPLKLGHFTTEEITKMCETKQGELRKSEQVASTQDVTSEDEDGNVTTTTVNGEILYVEEAIISNYAEGFTFVSAYSSDETVAKEKFESIYNEIKANTSYSKKFNGVTNLNIKGFGDKRINELNPNYSVLYNAKHGMFFLYDNLNEVSLMYITHVNNGNLANAPEKLIPIEEYKNVYVDFGYRNKSDYGYGSFAVMTDAGMYYFKVAEAVENPDEMVATVLDWLGVKAEDEKIEHGYNMMLTIENLRPTMEDEAKAKEEKAETSTEPVVTTENTENN